MMHALRILPALAIALGIAACSSDSAPAIDDNQSGGSTTSDASITDGGSSSGFCWDYCNTIAAKGTNCGSYNSNNRCVTDCNFYNKSVCNAEWQAFATCVTQCSGIECVPQDGGFPILSTNGCVTEGTTFHQCVAEKDAGFCNK